MQLDKPSCNTQVPDGGPIFGDNLEFPIKAGGVPSASILQNPPQQCVLSGMFAKCTFLYITLQKFSQNLGYHIL